MANFKIYVLIFKSVTVNKHKAHKHKLFSVLNDM